MGPLSPETVFITEHLAAGVCPPGWTAFDTWQKAYSAMCDVYDPAHGYVVPTVEDVRRLLIDGCGWPEDICERLLNLALGLPYSPGRFSP